ncbi:hypothetical protein TNCV_4333471 [Trichonephila clavipes]|nr:hypothetical protein TNCV_4333471 [Trichonephila clavipes]
MKYKKKQAAKQKICQGTLGGHCNTDKTRDGKPLACVPLMAPGTIFWERHRSKHDQPRLILVQFRKYLFRAFEPLQSALYQSRLDPQPFPSQTEISERIILQTLQQQLNTTST